MVFDAHIHVGYFPRRDGRTTRGGGDAYYYSPARVMQYMRWAGADEFLFSSTNACWDAHAESMHPEAAELLRLARLQGMKAHPFFWVSRVYLAWDPELAQMPPFYAGIKLHGGEAHWTEHPAELRRVLAIASERRMPVQIHTSNDDENGCAAYLPYCREFGEVRIDLAHGHRIADAIRALRECPNVRVDTSFMTVPEIEQAFAVAPRRVMFGSDFPAPLRFYDGSCTIYIRTRIREQLAIGGDQLLCENARNFLGCQN